MTSSDLLPKLTINDTSVPPKRQQCVLKPSKSAYEIKIRSKHIVCAPSTPSQKLLWSEETALKEAKRLAVSFGGSKNPEEKEYLGQLVLIFGKYVNRNFKWLIEHDVGYVKYLLDHHTKEMKKMGTVRDAWLKNLLHRYVSYFPPVSSHLEENIDKCIYGIGVFRHYTYKEMFDHYYQHKTNQSTRTESDKNLSKKIYDQVRQWLCMHPEKINSNAMKRFQLYIKEKEKEVSMVSTTSKFSPSKLDVSWNDDSSIFEAIKLETEALKPKRISSAQKPTSTISVAPSDSSSSSVILSNIPSTSNSFQSIDSTKKEKDLSSIVYEGWHKSWEDDIFNSIPEADRHWLKMDTDRGLFQPIQTFKDAKGNLRSRKVLKIDRMWFYPPEPPGVIGSGIPKPDAFFHNRVFFWRPVGVWGYKFYCPKPSCQGNYKAYLYRNGYHTRPRLICDTNEWYIMLSELLSCSVCYKDTPSKIVAWDSSIIDQLTASHQALFPAVLTGRRGVDKKVIQLMTERSSGNTIAKTWRQLQENHSMQYLQRKDLYTTLLYTLTKEGGITRAFKTTCFLPPPSRRETPGPKLLQKAYLISEAEKVEEYRTKIMSTFGKILKFDSTKKICKKISGAGRGTAEWCTNVGNEWSQILSFVFTCEESVAKLQPMAEGLMDRYVRAGEDPPLVMFVDRGCCKKQGSSAVENLFHSWTDSGMVIRLDAWHWIHRFDAAVRSDSHPKYAIFKSALSGALFAYNKSDLSILIKAVRAGDSNLQSLTDDDIIQNHISRKQLQHHVRRITVGAQETYRLVHFMIKELKSEAGLDANGISLFKSEVAIDEVWAKQQHHLECLQDPPGMSFYTVLKHINVNGNEVPFYKCSRGNNSLEGFHAHLKNMVPGDHCSLESLQIYLLSGISRWNTDRDFEAVKGSSGRQHRSYSVPLMQRLNARCKELFGNDAVEEVNFRPPIPPGNELLGVEFLLKQSEPSFQVDSHYSLVKKGLEEEDDDDDADDSDDKIVQNEVISDPDPGYSSEPEDDTIPATRKETKLTTTDLEAAPELDSVIEDVCGLNHLPGYDAVEELSSLLLHLAENEEKLTVDTALRTKIMCAFNKLSDLDKKPKKFREEYNSRWGNTLYKKTSGEPQQAAMTQKVKFGVRYTPAHHIDNSNRLVYTIIKQLWLKLKPNTSVGSLKSIITSQYQRIQHRVLAEDRILSQMSIPLPKINTKCVAEFMRRQEALMSVNSTYQATSLLTKEKHVTDIEMPEASVLPQILPENDRPQIPMVQKECLAGKKSVRRRENLHLVQKSTAEQSQSECKPKSQVSLILSPTYHSIPSTSDNPSTSSYQVSRSTFYKHLKRERDSSVEDILPAKRKSNIPYCALCKKPSLGHKKYKKKTFCDEMKKSTSKGLMGKEFKSFDDFKQFIDSLE